MSIKFLVLGGAFWGGGGGSADFIFMGARIFLSFYYAPQIDYAMNPCLKRKMPAKPRKIVSAQEGGRHSKSECDSKFTTHSKFTTR